MLNHFHMIFVVNADKIVIDSWKHWGVVSCGADQFRSGSKAVQAMDVAVPGNLLLPRHARGGRGEVTSTSVLMSCLYHLSVVEAGTGSPHQNRRSRG